MQGIVIGEQCGGDIVGMKREGLSVFQHAILDVDGRAGDRAARGLAGCAPIGDRAARRGQVK